MRRDTENNEARVTLLNRIPWQLFATFTFTRKLKNGDEERRWIWAEFLRRVHDAHRDTLGYIWAEESRRAWREFARIAPHFHALFVSNKPISVDLLANLWSSFAGTDRRASKIEPFDPRKDGIRYVTKMMDTQDSYGDYSKDLVLFLPGTYAANDRQSRRRQRRHAARAERAQYYEQIGL